MKKTKEYILSASAWLFGLLAFISGSFILLVIGIFHTGNVFERTIKILCRWVLFCAGIKLKVTGFENIDLQKQYIIMMNHINIMDGFVFYAKYPGKARGIEEESHFKWPLYGWVIRRMGQFPVNRKSLQKAMETLKKAAELIRNKKEFSVAVLPEGTRTITGKLGKFKKGGFFLALEVGLDILPIIQMGSFNFKRKGCWMMRPGKVEVVYEKPIATSGYSKENITDLIQKTRNLFLKYID
jgi:1-acyl-sn-glycerol-3-phosphate acyltransferase